MKNYQIQKLINNEKDLQYKYIDIKNRKNKELSASIWYQRKMSHFICQELHSFQKNLSHFQIMKVVYQKRLDCLERQKVKIKKSCKIFTYHGRNLQKKLGIEPLNPTKLYLMIFNNIKYNSLSIILILHYQRMKEEPFLIDQKRFKTLITQKVRFRKDIQEPPVQAIYRVSHLKGYQDAIKFEFLEKYARPHYVQILQQLITKMNQAQEEQARKFCDKNLCWLQKKGWLKEKDLTKVSQYLHQGELIMIEKLMKDYGFKERFPNQFAILISQFQKTQQDMFRSSIKKIFCDFLQKQVQKDRANRKEWNLPTQISSLNQFEQYCHEFKIYYHQEYIDIAFESVKKIGLQSNKIIALLKASTFPGFEEEFIYLLTKVNSQHLNTKILLDLVSIYLFLSLDFKLNEETISTIVRAYYESQDKYKNIIQRIGFQEEDQENYAEISKTFQFYIEDIYSDKVKTIMIEEIKQYDTFMKLLFKVKQQTKQVKEFDKKLDYVQKIYRSQQNPIQQIKYELNLIIACAREQYKEIQKAKISATIEEYKRLICSFLFFQFESKNFRELKNSFKKQRAPSLQIKKISFDKLSELDISGRISFQSDQYENLLLMDFFQNNDDSNRKTIDKLLNVNLPKNKRITQSQYGISSAITQPGEISPIKKEKIQMSQRQYTIYEQREYNTFKLMAIVIPNKKCQKVLIKSNNEIELEQKKIPDCEFYYRIMNLEQQVQFDKIRVQFEPKIKKSVITSFLKSKFAESEEVSVLASLDETRITKLHNGSGILLINEINDQNILGQVIFQCFRSMTDSILKKKNEKLSKFHIDITFLLASLLNNKLQDKNLILTSKIKYHQSHQITVLFIYFIYTIFKERTYHLFQKGDIISKLSFVKNGIDFLTQQFNQNESLKRLYSKLMIKHIIIKPLFYNNDAKEIIQKYFRQYKQEISLNKLHSLCRLYPTALLELNDDLHQFMITQPNYDAFDFMIMKMRFMKKKLEDKSTSTKFDFFRKFIIEIQQFRNKQTKKSQSQKLKILQFLIHQIGKLLINSSYFFSKSICFSQAMIIELYKQSKILKQNQEQIGQFFIQYLFPFIVNPGDSDILFEKIQTFLMKPQTHKQFAFLQKYFKNNSIPLQIFKNLVDLEINNSKKQNYLWEELNFLLVDYIINNKDFISLQTERISEMLLFLVNKYSILNHQSRQLEQISVQTRQNEEKCLNLKHKIRLIIKRIGQQVSQMRCESKQKKERKLNELLVIKNKLKYPQFQSMLQNELQSSLSMSQKQLELKQQIPISFQN